MTDETARVPRPELAAEPGPVSPPEQAAATEPEAKPGPAPAKLNPETLALRTQPPRAIRFKREVIIAIAGGLALGVGGVAWMALGPQWFQKGGTSAQMSEPNGRATSEALNHAPATYGDVPRLGPPLPGDLGKPILDHQQAMANAVDPLAVQLRQGEQTERDRQLAELKAARESGLLVQGRQMEPAAPASAPATTGAGPADPAKVTLDPANAPNAQGHKTAFVDRLDPRGDVNPHAVMPQPSPYTLSAGSVITASLITGLNSDLPGPVIAQVTQNTYDSATGRFLLVPQGARLIGAYDSVVAFGQRRALVIWQRIILPDGSSLRIDNVTGADMSGYAGLADKVDFHTWQLLKGVALSTMLGVSYQLALSGQSDLVQAMRTASQDSESRAADMVTQRNLGIQPTITIRPGAPVLLVVHKDLVFAKGGEG